MPSLFHVQRARMSSEASPSLSPQLMVLENHASMTSSIDKSPNDLPKEALSPENRLRRVYSNLHAIFFYLGRFDDEQEASRYLVSFEQDEASKDTELYKARAAIVTIITSIVHAFQAIPQTAPVRKEASLVFDISGAIFPLYDVFLEGQEGPPGVPDWGTFWDRSQPILLTLASALDDAGLGMTEPKTT